IFFFSSRRRHTRFSRDWSSEVCSSDLPTGQGGLGGQWLALLQRAPRTAEVVAEAAGDVLAVAAQLAHAVQEQQLRRTGALGPVRSEERRVGKERRPLRTPGRYNTATTR